MCHNFKIVVATCDFHILTRIDSMELSNMSVINSHSASVHVLLDKDSRPSVLYLFKTEEQINLTLDLQPRGTSTFHL